MWIRKCTGAAWIASSTFGSWWCLIYFVRQFLNFVEMTNIAKPHTSVAPTRLPAAMTLNRITHEDLGFMSGTCGTFGLSSFLFSCHALVAVVITAAAAWQQSGSSQRHHRQWVGGHLGAPSRGGSQVIWHSTQFFTPTLAQGRMFYTQHNCHHLMQRWCSNRICIPWTKSNFRHTRDHPHKKIHVAGSVKSAHPLTAKWHCPQQVPGMAMQMAVAVRQELLCHCQCSLYVRCRLMVVRILISPLLVARMNGLLFCLFGGLGRSYSTAIIFFAWVWRVEEVVFCCPVLIFKTDVVCCILFYNSCSDSFWL